MSDNGLNELTLAAVALGDAAATDRWYRSEFPKVFRLCFGFTAGSDAEDLARDAMVHLVERLDSRRRDRSYPAWRDAVVANLCRDRLRRAVTRRDHEEHSPSLPERLPDPAVAAERNETRVILAAALAELPDRQREVFVLRDLEGTPARDVAESLDITPSTVRSLLDLARTRLRGLLRSKLPAGCGGE